MTPNVSDGNSVYHGLTANLRKRFQPELGVVVFLYLVTRDRRFHGFGNAARTAGQFSAE
jgi:hypothetical protein